MHHYTAFGLNIEADLPLPELLERDGSEPADVLVHHGDLGTPPPLEALNDQYRLVQVADEEVYVFWDFLGAVLVREGSEIIFDPFPDVAESAVRSVLVGVALGIVLHQRGFFTLHASAVATGEGAVAFIGQKGMGKSTTAAALCARGHHLVSDDVVALPPAADDSDAPLSVCPGFPQLKLWPNAVEAALGDDLQRLSKLDPRSEKRARPVRENFRQRPLPLRCIYVLDYDAGLSEEAPARILSMPPQAVFKALAAHSYAVGFTGEKAGPAHLRYSTRLAQEVPVRRLVRAPSLDRLSEVARCVEEDMTQCSTEKGGVPSPAVQSACASSPARGAGALSVA